MKAHAILILVIMFFVFGFMTCDMIFNNGRFVSVGSITIAVLALIKLAYDEGIKKGEKAKDEPTPPA